MNHKDKVQLLKESLTLIFVVLLFSLLLFGCAVRANFDIATKPPQDIPAPPTLIDPATTEEHQEIMKSCDDIGYPFNMLHAEAMLRGDKHFAVFNDSDSKKLTDTYNALFAAYRDVAMKPTMVGLFAHIDPKTKEIISNEMLLIFIEGECVVEFAEVLAEDIRALLNGEIIGL